MPKAGLLCVAVIMPNAMCGKNSFNILKKLQPTDYREIWELQRRLNENVYYEEMPETLLLVTHKPVYTLGFHGDINNMLVSQWQLSQLNADLVRIERGGDITFHGPGQLVVYPIINLRRRGYGVKDYIRRLEQSVIETCMYWDIKASIMDEAPGVWCRLDEVPLKICALGVKVKKGITMHGLALNVTTDLSWFSYINPCGFKQYGVTSMQQELLAGNAPSIDEVAEVLQSNLQNLL